LEDGVEKLFFELSSESRLSILSLLQRKELKMNEVARELDLTSTETFRQLQRLSESSLIQRQPTGAYAVTQYGRLVIQFSASLGFFSGHRDYFIAHDFSALPRQFLARIGDISEAELVTGMLKSTSRSSRIITSAEEYMWGISLEPLPQGFEELAKSIPEGVTYRFVSPMPPARLPNLENRTFTPAPVALALTEKEAGVSFRHLDGRMDYAGFYGGDMVFMAWVRDLFNHYWERGKPY
jgi:predicted transcriptional regulator